MLIANVALMLSLMGKWSVVSPCHAFAQASVRPARYYASRQSTPSSFSSAFSSLPMVALAQPRHASFLTATPTSEETEQTEESAEPLSWSARQDGWRPDVRDVEKISWGQPAKKKKTGSRGVPHRLNEDERRSFDQARRQGFLQVTGSSWRSQRRDAPLLNTYRSLMDARGRPMIVLHKQSSGEDIMVVDLSPLRLPDDFARVEQELKDRVLAEFDVEIQIEELEEEDVSDDITDMTIEDSNTNDDGDDWGTRPIYQLSPYSLSWEVSRQQGKQIGKFLGLEFDNVEEKATKSQKPKGNKPGKGRRHGGYGI